MVEDMNGQEHEVCRTACQALTGWSAWYLSDSKNQILTGMDKLKEEDMREMSLYLKQTELKNEINERWNWAFIWMDVHCEIIGCQQPTTNLTHLDPVFIGELCDEYNAAPANAQYIVYHQEFGNIFRHWLVQVRIRRKKETSTECFRSVHLRLPTAHGYVCRCRYTTENVRKATGGARVPAMKEKALHRQWFKGMRNIYNKLIQLSIINMMMVCSIVFDGMDQWKTYAPHLYGKSNEMPSWRFKQKLTGAAMFGGIACSLIEACRPDIAWFCLDIHHHVWLDLWRF